MKIQEVTIEGYQSHTNSTFCLSPGLTVITGPSDAGKTAIIRALRWFAFNEPTGEAFLHTIRNPDGSIKEAVDQAKVSVTFEDGTTITKTRRKGKTTYTHSGYPTAWEKAEIPPEIKETLGLVKQAYGDFETCLNFAFQLDAPFMLSETASVGAKVLGKLAGTEIVDRAISDVNKKTHQVRTDISYAEKQIGEIDVSLTEYFDLDTHDESLRAAENAFTRIKEDRERYTELVELMNNYQTETERRIALFDKVESLAGVVVASVTLSTVEREQARKEKLQELDAGFWTAVKDQKEPNRVLRATSNLESLTECLQAAIAYNLEVFTLDTLYKQYQKHRNDIQVSSDTLIALEKVVGLSDKLDTVERDLSGKEALQDVNRRLWETMVKERDLRNKVTSMGNLDDAQHYYNILEGTYTALDNLKRVNAVYTSVSLSRLAAEVALEKTRKEAEEAKNELHEAWEAAGGVCPLCGSEVENESI